MDENELQAELRKIRRRKVRMYCPVVVHPGAPGGMIGYRGRWFSNSACCKPGHLVRVGELGVSVIGWYCEEHLEQVIEEARHGK